MVERPIAFFSRYNRFKCRYKPHKGRLTVYCDRSRHQYVSAGSLLFIYISALMSLLLLSLYEYIT